MWLWMLYQVYCNVMADALFYQVWSDYEKQSRLADCGTLSTCSFEAASLKRDDDRSRESHRKIH
jgi:hypothetical protein